MNAINKLSLHISFIYFENYHFIKTFAEYVLSVVGCLAPKTFELIGFLAFLLSPHQKRAVSCPLN
jgi:hypothetical protein